MHVLRVRHIAIAAAVSTSVLSAGLPAQPPPQATPPAGQPPQQGAQQAQGQQPPRRPRPYAQVITNRAVTDAGGITVHRVDDRWFFEVPDSLVMRDFLFVTRVAGVPANFGGFTSAGTSLEERLVRFERNLERVVLRSLEVGAYADDSLPIARSVAENNYGPILAAFPIQAFGRDSTTYVIDVTDFFAGDTPGISGLNAAQRLTVRADGNDVICPGQAATLVLKTAAGPKRCMIGEVRHLTPSEVAELTPVARARPRTATELAEAATPSQR